jgi:hypothetical protein
MTQFTRTHGDYQPVQNMDSPAYTVGAINAVTSAATVQPQGPKLDYFTIVASGSTAFSTTQVNVMIQTIQQKATIYIYEFTTAGPDTLAVAVYPVGVWATVDATYGANANVVAAVNAALTAASVANTTTGLAYATFTG